VWRLRSEGESVFPKGHRQWQEETNALSARRVGIERGRSNEYKLNEWIGYNYRTRRTEKSAFPERSSETTLCWDDVFSSEKDPDDNMP